jgi:8-oxo-dGTP pyrophosphatase MutT (NUDIX family)
VSVESETGATMRVAARVLLLDEHGAVLHIGGDRCLEGVVRWFVPGGGVDPGETLAGAAAREIAEETGLAVAPDALGAPVAHGVIVAFPNGRLWIQKNWYFFHRVERFEPRVVGGDRYERRLGFAWLPADRCGATDGTLVPELMVALVKGLRDGGRPAEPVDLGGTYCPRFGP